MIENDSATIANRAEPGIEIHSTTATAIAGVTMKIETSDRPIRRLSRLRNRRSSGLARRA